MTNIKGVADHADTTLGKTVSELTEDGMTTGEPTSETMLNNEAPDGNDNVLMRETDWPSWLRAAGIRVIKTGAQTLITLIGTDMVSIVQLDWTQMLAVTATTMVLSLLTSIAGLPEVDDGKSPISTR
jgi:hypothetical protein